MTGPRSTHDDLIYSERHRKGWKSKGRRYPYKNKSTGCDESLSIPQIAKRASMRDEKARKHLNDWDWSVEKLFDKFGDTGATPPQEKKMGCEFSDKVRLAKQQIVKELYDKLTGPHQCKFVSLYGFPEQTAESETYKAYYHCKRVLKTYPTDPNK